MANAMGALGISVEHSEDIEGGTAAGFRARRAGAGRCRDRQARTRDAAGDPVEQAKGFSLYMLKAILNGRGDEIVELVKTNLRR